MNIDNTKRLVNTIKLLRHLIISNHKYSTPLSEFDRLVDLELKSSDETLDDICVDGGNHRVKYVDNKPYPCICIQCDRPLP